MTRMYKAMAWAGAILLVAVGSYAGLVADDLARTLFIVLPILAIVSLGGACGCRPLRREG